MKGGGVLIQKVCQRFIVLQTPGLYPIHARPPCQHVPLMCFRIVLVVTAARFLLQRSQNMKHETVGRIV